MVTEKVRGMGPGGGVVDIMCWIVPGIEQVTERDLVPCFGQCPRMLRSSYRGALTGSACQQARLLETEDRTGSAPKAWGHHLAKCAPRHGVSAESALARKRALSRRHVAHACRSHYVL